MERRNFIVASLALFGTIKTLAAKTRDGLKTSKFPTDIGSLDPNKVVYLKRSETFILPEKPTPIETVVHFSTKKYRFGKSPIISSNGHKIDGNQIENLILNNDIKLNNQTEFYMQYTGTDIGWIILI